MTVLEVVAEELVSVGVVALVELVVEADTGKEATKSVVKNTTLNKRAKINLLKSFPKGCFICFYP